MDRTKLMRLLIEQSKVTKWFPRERIEFTRLSPDETGLPYYIYVDNGGCYKKFHHQLWLHVDCCGERVAVSIGPNPAFINFVNAYYFSEGPLFRFIRQNHKLLKQLADGDVYGLEFYDYLKVLDEYENVNGDGSFLLNEMATVHQKFTGLPTNIWVDENATYMKHAPRIKFNAGPPNNSTYQYSSIEIKNPDRIYNLPKKMYITTKDIEMIKLFVLANQDNLLALCDSEIDYRTFLDNMRHFDKNGNIVGGKKTIVGKFMPYVNIAVCRRNGKVNYKRKDGSYLFNDFILDDGTNFLHYMDDIYLAYVTKDGESYYIDTDGNKVNIC